jgi:hypothetical protein
MHFRHGHSIHSNELTRALNARDSPQRGEFYQVAVAALRQLARVQRASYRLARERNLIGETAKNSPARDEFS